MGCDFCGHTPLSVVNRFNSLLTYLMLRIHLLPRILEGYGTILELLAYDLDVLLVLLTVCPVLLVLHAVATCALQLLHVLTVDGVLELH